MKDGVVPPLRGEWGCRTIALVLMLILAPATVVGAQDACAARASDSTRQWSPPLDRRVTLRAHDLSLREALDRLAEDARLRLSYSSDLLPLERRVCVSFTGVMAGDALVELVGSAAVEPVAAGSDQVVLAPVRRAATAESHALTTDDIGLLQRVVITGNAPRIPQRPLTVSIDVLKGAALTRQGATSVSQMVDAAVPGIWLWNQSPSTLLARYGSIRGASSFGLSYPKMYLDGIEIANPLLLTHFTPELVDRIEVIRGPQGAALYGADAISGVVNIYTRHDGVDADGERLQLQTGAGLTESRFAPHAVIAQEHSLSLRAGDAMRSASLAVSGASLGDFVPNAFSREVRGSGALRIIGSRSTLTGTARLYAKEADLASNPLLSELRPAGRVYGFSAHPLEHGAGMASDTNAMLATTDSAPQTMKQYTLGATATFAQNERWTHSFVAGIDGYRLTNVPDELTPIPSPMDSALRAARGGGDRTTLRASSVAQLFGEGNDRLAATLTFAAEHSMLRQETTADPIAGRVFGKLASTTNWSSASGLIAQGNASLDDSFFLTSGLRLERDGQAGAHQVALLPTVGIATVREFGSVAAKLRAAYGRGIRTAHTATRQSELLGMRYGGAASSLAPEQQKGTELGGDLFFGRQLSLHVTRFDQRAYGLIQPVVTGANAVASGPSQVMYALQNVGEIANDGWELQSSIEHGRLSVEGALSLVDSRVVRIANGYTGDLRAGDRMLAVPARTGSLSASWSGMRWFTSLTAMRASDWVNYDRLGLARLLADSSRAVASLTGERLRDYWRGYPGVTRLRATMQRDLRRGFVFVLTADNLLNEQQGEPDDVTVLPGRTITAGIRARF